MRSIWLFIKRLFGIKEPLPNKPATRSDAPGEEPPVEDKGDGLIGPRPNDR